MTKTKNTPRQTTNGDLYWPVDTPHETWSRARRAADDAGALVVDAVRANGHTHTAIENHIDAIRTQHAALIVWQAAHESELVGRRP